MQQFKKRTVIDSLHLENHTKRLIIIYIRRLFTRINSHRKTLVNEGRLRFLQANHAANNTDLAIGNEATKNVCSILSGGVAAGRLLINWAARISNTKMN
jgi:hypothetical protein